MKLEVHTIYNKNNNFDYVKIRNKAILISTIVFLLNISFCINLYSQIGEIDPDFNLGTGFGVDNIQGRVETIVIQPDQKILVGGWFTEYNGSPVGLITRLNPNGSIDNSFNIGTGFTGISAYVKTIVIQPDGKILVGGNFLEFNGTNRHRIARLNSDGSLDTSFDPLTGFNSDVNSIAIQDDGKIIVAGIFSSYDWLNSGGIARPRITRLNSDGSLDTSFDPQNGFTSGAQARVHKVIIQPDGKILACGQFDKYNDTESVIIARLNNDGSLDNTFDTGSQFNLVFGFYGEAWDMSLLENGKIMLAGNFSHSGAGNSGLIRLNADGGIDNSFMVNTKSSAVAVQTDGKVLTSATGPYIFSRYNADGTTDSEFNQTMFNDVAQTIVIQKDGNILIGGWFQYNPRGLMRVIGDTPSSVEEMNDSNIELKIFPTPAKNQISVVLEDLNIINNSALVTITNLTGKIMFEQKLFNFESQGTIKLDISNLENGVYIFSLNIDGKIFSKKINISK